MSVGTGKLSVPEVIKSFLDKLDEFGIRYEYNKDSYRVKIRGYIGFAVADNCGFDFYHDENKALSISMDDKKDGIRVMIADLKDFRHVELTLPSNTFITFEKGYLHVKFFP
jgi:hypothetical protein